MKLLIQILIDNPNSWILEYAKRLVSDLSKLHNCVLLYDKTAILKGDVLILLSCEGIIENSYLSLNTNNFVVHESDLPNGKGWSPLTWQILEGKKEIKISLFEAKEKIDSGPIYSQLTMKFKGSELVGELREIQGNATIDLIKNVIAQHPNFHGTIQKGESTYYPKRTLADSELNIYKTIDEQFNLLRVVDNERYPAYFIKDNIRYTLKIEKD